MQKPVVISCTSGSAAANYYPAITEAFYQNVPLIILTADRPEGYADLFDGQTIRQKNLFDQHVYHSIQLDENEGDESITDNFLEIKKAIHQAIIHSGPVHINMPLSEPLYESISEKLISFDSIGKPIKVFQETDWVALKTEYNQGSKVMILMGQELPNEELDRLIAKLSLYPNIIILTETTSNIHNSQTISQIDAVIRNINEEDKEFYSPDLLITIGQRVISKKIKQYLRSHAPKNHWHIDPFWHPDTYFSLTQKVIVEPTEFLKYFLEKLPPKESSYKLIWRNIEAENDHLQEDLMNKLAWSDLLVFKSIIENYLPKYVIHYSNSSVIRYAQLFKHQPSNPVFCNRGTSGIDGSTSTAIGFAMKSEKPVVLVTGDISFFYDSNALWNNYIPSNFRIILINNGGGNIFKIIPGPSKSNALETFFETKHNLNGSHLAKMFGFDYSVVDSIEELTGTWKSFYEESGSPKILEISTQSAPNAETLHRFFQVLHN